MGQRPRKISHLVEKIGKCPAQYGKKDLGGNAKTPAPISSPVRNITVSGKLNFFFLLFISCDYSFNIFKLILKTTILDIRAAAILDRYVTNSVREYEIEREREKEKKKKEKRKRKERKMRYDINKNESCLDTSETREAAFSEHGNGGRQGALEREVLEDFLNRYQRSISIMVKKKILSCVYMWEPDTCMGEYFMHLSTSVMCIVWCQILDIIPILCVLSLRHKNSNAKKVVLTILSIDYQDLVVAHASEDHPNRRYIGYEMSYRSIWNVWNEPWRAEIKTITKSVTRGSRATDVSRTHHLQVNSKLPAQKILLTSSKNKRQLMQLIVDDFVQDKKFHEDNTQHHKLVVTGADPMPIKISEGGVVISRADLSTSHEEADNVIVQQVLSCAAENT
ncbi:hypothetical protein GQR58_018955 [Nymphon striatum]|nr:hypothetical protein GQR58_018955 [Nymphon striatum]